MNLDGLSFVCLLIANNHNQLKEMCKEKYYFERF